MRGTRTGETVPTLLPLLRNEVRAFGERYELTRREHDVLSMLLQGASSVASIADGLALSRNTIHNHFKNMFRRTGAENKAALIAMFARESAARCARDRATHRRPRVVILAPSAPQLPRIEASLRARGIHASTVHEPAEAERVVAAHGVDVILLIADTEADADGMRQALRARVGARVRIVVGEELWGESGYRPGLDAEASLANDAMVFGVLLAFLEGDDARNRLVRVEVRLDGELSGTGPVQILNVGFGGAFVPLPPAAAAALRTPDGPVRLRIQLPLHGAIEAATRVAWTRSPGQDALPAGVGLAFTDMQDTTRAALETFVRRRKLAWLALEATGYRR